MSVFQATSEAKLSHCAQFKINAHNIPTNTPSSCLIVNKAVVCWPIVLLPKGSKHEDSQMIWFGAE